jgi:hypothetical protein
MWGGLTSGLSSALQSLDQVLQEAICLFESGRIFNFIFSKAARDVVQRGGTETQEDNEGSGTTHKNIGAHSHLYSAINFISTSMVLTSLVAGPQNRTSRNRTHLRAVRLSSTPTSSIFSIATAGPITATIPVRPSDSAFASSEGDEDGRDLDARPRASQNLGGPNSNAITTRPEEHSDQPQSLSGSVGESHDAASGSAVSEGGRGFRGGWFGFAAPGTDGDGFGVARESGSSDGGGGGGGGGDSDFSDVGDPDPPTTTATEKDAGGGGSLLLQRPAAALGGAAALVGSVSQAAGGFLPLTRGLSAAAVAAGGRVGGGGGLWERAAAVRSTLQAVSVGSGQTGRLGLPGVTC